MRVCRVCRHCAATCNLKTSQRACPALLGRLLSQKSAGEGGALRINDRHCRFCAFWRFERGDFDGSGWLFVPIMQGPGYFPARKLDVMTFGARDPTDPRALNAITLAGEHLAKERQFLFFTSRPTQHLAHLVD